LTVIRAVFLEREPAREGDDRCLGRPYTSSRASEWSRASRASEIDKRPKRRSDSPEERLRRSTALRKFASIITRNRRASDARSGARSSTTV